jgi:hypothetical protein
VAHRPRRLVTAALALALGATGCAKDRTPGPPLASGSSGGPSATATTTPNATGSGRPSAPASSGGPTSGASGAPGSPSASYPSLRVTVAVRDRCVRPGGKQVAVVTTTPFANVSLNTLYADTKEGSAHGGLGGGTADGAGRYTYAWTVRPGTPAGKAYTRAKAERNGAGGSAITQFLVAGTC